MARSYWLVNSNRLRIKRFIENPNNKDQFLNICLSILERLLPYGAKNHLSLQPEKNKRKNQLQKNGKN